MEAKKAVLCAWECISCSIRTSFRFVIEHPFLLCTLCYAVILRRYFPALFPYIVSISPVIIFAALLLGALLVYGEPNVPGVEEEERRWARVTPCLCSRSVSRHLGVARVEVFDELPNREVAGDFESSGYNRRVKDDTLEASYSLFEEAEKGTYGGGQLDEGIDVAPQGPLERSVFSSRDEVFDELPNKEATGGFELRGCNRRENDDTLEASYSLFEEGRKGTYGGGQLDEGIDVAPRGLLERRDFSSHVGGDFDFFAEKQFCSSIDPAKNPIERRGALLRSVSGLSSDGCESDFHSTYEGHDNHEYNDDVFDELPNKEVVGDFELSHRSSVCELVPSSRCNRRAKDDSLEASNSLFDGGRKGIYGGGQLDGKIGVAPRGPLERRDSSLRVGGDFDIFDGNRVCSSVASPRKPIERRSALSKSVTGLSSDDNESDVHFINEVHDNHQDDFDDDDDDDETEDDDDDDDEEFDEDEDEEDDDDDEEEEDKEGQDESMERVVEWTAADQKNLTDIGTSELERNRRMETLLARRLSGKNMQSERDLIDLNADNSIRPVIEHKSGHQIHQVSPSRRNPFDLPYAPSVLPPRKNPFDLPEDGSVDEGGGHMVENFASTPQRETIFRRHESFSAGPSLYSDRGQYAQNSRLKHFNSIPRNQLYSFPNQIGDPVQLRSLSSVNAGRAYFDDHRFESTSLVTFQGARSIADVHGTAKKEFKPDKGSARGDRVQKYYSASYSFDVSKSVDSDSELPEEIANSAYGYSPSDKRTFKGRGFPCFGSSASGVWMEDSGISSTLMSSPKKTTALDARPRPLTWGGASKIEDLAYDSEWHWVASSSLSSVDRIESRSRAVPEIMEDDVIGGGYSGAPAEFGGLEY